MGGGLIGFKDFTEKEIQMIIIQIASVKSINLWKSVIQTNYDIVKAHGGELKVETKEGEGSTFIVQLPVV
jgi:light-regulated signal transduction histidine kinase (bacteriophytochrome)